MTPITCGVTAGLAVLIRLLGPATASPQNAAALYREHRAGCLDAGGRRAPAREALQTMSAEGVLTALESGAMLSMGSRMSTADRRALAQFLTGKSLSARDLTITPPQQAMCTTPSPGSGASANPPASASWNGWGANTNNTRFQDGAGAGLTPAQVSRLKVKWAFGFPGDLDANAQPSIVGGRVFVGSQGGTVYALSPETGCVHWSFKATGAVRGAVTVGMIAGQSLAAFFGDLTGSVYA